MAGKTLFGVGGPGDEPPGDDTGEGTFGDEEPRGVYSGPTVVDDDKVAESLRRLRALDRQQARPADPAVGADAGEVAEGILDTSSSEPTRINLRPATLAVTGLPKPGDTTVFGFPAADGSRGGPERPTAVGHGASIATTADPVTPPDPMRGTLFGHSIHLPNINAPDSAPDVPSGAVHIIESGPTPAPLKPLPKAAIKASIPMQRPAIAPTLALDRPVFDRDRPINDGLTVPRQESVAGTADETDRQELPGPPTRGKLALVVIMSAVATVLAAIAGRAWFREGSKGADQANGGFGAPPPVSTSPPVRPTTVDPGGAAPAPGLGAPPSGAVGEDSPPSARNTGETRETAPDNSGSSGQAADSPEAAGPGAKRGAASARPRSTSGKGAQHDRGTRGERADDRATAAGPRKPVDGPNRPSPGPETGLAPAAGAGPGPGPGIRPSGDRPAGERKRGKSDEDPDGTLPPSD